jgi:hypothetical protein
VHPGDEGARSKIAQGGTYRTERSIAGNGDVTGIAVASFKARGLGTVCVGYTVKAGKFVPGSSFVPMSGTLKTIGGTGTAARWRGSVSYKQTGVSGMSIENFTASGSEQGHSGKAQRLSLACKHVKALAADSPTLSRDELGPREAAARRAAWLLRRR